MEFEIDFVIGLGFFMVVSICLMLGAKILNSASPEAQESENRKSGFFKKLMSADEDFYCFFHKNTLYKK
ncbi:hypothetical protein [Maridesulfovibrio bastinii]|jgi:hypothetical protein|uniref:hypothetical protein n=1 Tax=Maridesulfovibrio bastinii TaxID=47157 RepID=UPI0004242F07|nr:hypothetical protein [Maridesulfovibrio bastinii]